MLQKLEARYKDNINRRCKCPVVSVRKEIKEFKLDRFIERFQSSLNRFNFIKDYDFGVYVSYGSHLIHPDENISIESCLNVADKLMYHQKKGKESVRC